ncbi:MAG: type II toxin-antitoxin system Phd/YefM family antitoxin [Thermoleophilia bacterium]|jgi:prevent-host-death family protein
MPRIGIRDLKTHTSDVLRNVRNARARYVVTRRGQPVAMIIPYSPKEAGMVLTREEGWARFFEASEQLGRKWKTPLTAVEILDEMRR